MYLELFFLWVELFSGVILLFISTWAYLSFKLKTFKKAFKISIIASVILINASFFSLTGNELLSRIFVSVAIFLLSLSFAILINSARFIGLGR